MQNTLVLSVSQLNRYIKMNFDADENLANIFISGEISNFTNHYRTGHLYFTLKDDSAAVRAVMFNSSAKRLKFMPEDGMKVIARGRVSVYEASGQYQLYVDDMQPDGVGALNLAYEQLKEKLQKEGLFSELHKKPLPPYPEKVGVITSPTGAAVRDIINVLGRRFPYAEIVFCPVLVQGEGAHLQLTDAVNLFNSERAADVIIIGRGGGSIEDLWEFNDEGLARAVYNSEIPVISAVGHETDFTICDFVADMRAPTPSAAAELAVPDANELQYALSALKNRMFLNVSSGIADRRSRLEYLTSKGALKSPDEMLSNRSQRLDTAFSKMLSSYENRIGGKKVEFISAATALSKLDPMSVLMRGFAFVSDKNGKNVYSSQALAKGDKINVRFHDGSAVCEVKEITQ
jgi:exodeoxyribonuclease VII large subunit|uniref:exodeoxyribonuclease VII large subunit n=1 Tax=Candidatus Fimenecus sp. TaxID=3022888 RepID=UPI0040258871